MRTLNASAKKGKDASKATTAAPEPKKVLIIDDDSVIVQGMQTALELSGYHVECMTTGRRTKDMIASLRPDIVFLDVMLDGMDGRDITREIKKDAAMRDVPVIVISAAHNIDRSVLAAGADDFIPKPFSVADLVDRVEYYVPSGKEK